MVIKKYKFRCYFKRAPRDNIWIEASSFRSHEREGERKERKKKRGKTLHLFVSSRLRFIGHPLSSHTRYSNAFSPLFFHEVASLSGYRINPSPGDNVETGSWGSSSPPWCNTGYPIEHRSSFPFPDRYLVYPEPRCFNSVLENVYPSRKKERRFVH